MIIGGFVENSLTDWNDRLVAVIFTSGCNFRCTYCHNPSLVLPEMFDNSPEVSEEDVLCYLKKRGDWLDGIVITGGEPTIHTDLPIFLKKLRKMGYSIKLDTNGTNPGMLSELITDTLIDFVAMDIKTVLDRDKYCAITGHCSEETMKLIRRSIDILRSSNIGYHFRTTVLPDFHSDSVIGLLDKMFYGEEYIKQSYRDGDNVGKYLK